MAHEFASFRPGRRRAEHLTRNFAAGGGVHPFHGDAGALEHDAVSADGRKPQSFRQRDSQDVEGRKPRHRMDRPGRRKPPKGETINVVIGAPGLAAASPAMPQPGLASGPDRGSGGVPVKHPLDLDGPAVDRHGGKRARGGRVKRGKSR